ncbi:MAG: YeeE/YedE family protein [Oscillochloridaceae bacterium umkhey_bin13]
MLQTPLTREPLDPTWPQLQRRAWLGLGLALAILFTLIAAAYWLHTTPGRGAPAALALALGAALGIVFERGRFCYFCILRDGIERNDTGPSYAILAALASGSLGYALLLGAFLPSPFSGRLPPEAHIGPVSWALALGGFVFGLGMALSGACVSGHLYRLGQGSTRAPFALFGTILGMALGLLSWNTLYRWTIAEAPILWLPAWLGYSGALALQLGLLALIGLLIMRGVPSLPARAATRLSPALIYKVLITRRWPPLVTGALVGAISAIAYLRIEPLGVTSQLGSLARTGLDGAGLLPSRLYGLDTLAGCATQVVTTITSNGLLIVGLVGGSLAAALAGGRFRPERLTVNGAVTALCGGLLQGWGALIALGCTVGTLLSGIAAFAVSGWVFAATMLLGVGVGMRLRWHTLGEG